MKKVKHIPVSEIKNKYHVSHMGTIHNIKTKRKLNGWVSKSGYQYFDLYLGKEDRYSAHRLIATFFIPNPFNYPCVNHIDGDKSNNIVDNLEWCTHQENTIHAYKKNLIKNRRVGRFTSKKLDMVRYLYKKYSQDDIAELLGVTQANISVVLKIFEK
jgi:hypothetical protein